MDRRDFVRQLGAGGAFAAVTPLAVPSQRAPAPADDRAIGVGMMRKPRSNRDSPRSNQDRPRSHRLR